ncbi:hypothetical protein GCM10027292_18610 [Hydrogenophaga aquatica]
MLLFGLACTAYVHRLVKDGVDTQARERFVLANKDLHAALRQSLLRQIDQLQGLRVLYEALQEVPQERLHQHLRTRELPGELPGLVALHHVSAQASSSQGPAGNLSIATLQGVPGEAPLASLRSEPGRQTLQKASLARLPAFTPVQDLFPGTAKRWGFHVIVPIAAPAVAGSPPAMEASAGQWLVATVLVHDWLEPAVGQLPAGMDVEVMTETEDRPPQVIYDADGHLLNLSTDDAHLPGVRALRQVKTLELGEHRLTLHSSATASFAHPLDRWAPLAAALSGSAVSLMAALAAWSLLSSRHRAERRAMEMASDLELMSRVARYTASAVAVTDTDHRITWINEAFIRQTGYAPDEAYGLTPDRLMLSPAADSSARQRMLDALDRRAPLEIEVLCRSKSGQDRWAALEMRPIADASATFHGYILIQTDIEGRRRDQEALEHALRDHEGLRRILDQHAIVSETDAEGTIIRVNDKFVQTSGYGAHELVGNSHRMLGSDAHPSAFWDQMWRTITSGRPWRGEICNRAKDGRLYWVDSLIAPLMGPDGQIDRFLSIHTDITQHKQAQAALVSSQDMLTRTGRVAGIGGWFADLESHTAYMSVECMQIFGVEPDWSVRIEPTLGYFVPQSRQPVLAAMDNAIHAEEAFDMVVEIQHPRAGRRWVRLVGEPDPEEGSRRRIVGAAQDITTQVQAQRRIEESERTMRSAIDAVGEAFALYDPQERLVFCNDKYREIYPRSRDTIMVGARYEDILRAGAERGEYPDAAGRTQEWVAERLAKFREPSSEDVMKLGNGRWLKVLGRTTSDGFHVGFRVDITEMHNALEAADAASRSKSQFLANMSHEIRTPMNAIMGMMTLLEHTGLSSRQHELVSKATSASRALLGILNDILDFSKVEAGKMQLDPEPFLLDDLLGDLSTILAGTLGARQLELVFDIDPALPRVLVGDAMRLKQILINLCGNAIKFTAKGEVVLQLRETGRANGAVQVRFQVEDTGIGISQEQQESIFSGFTQAEASTARRYGGTGLGLAISQRLVSLMGGELRLRSTPGEGSTFFFTVELELAPQAAAVVSLPSLGQHAALLIDDNSRSRKALQHMLQGLGWTVTSFPATDQAQAWLDETGPAPAATVLIANPDRPGTAALSERLASAMPQLQAADTGLARVWLRSNLPNMLVDPPPGTIELVKPVTGAMIASAVEALRQGVRTSERHMPPGGPRRLAGLRLLLVDDNDINLEVAQELLEREGAAVTVAMNGQAAIDTLRLNDTPFDLVLMDMQMPVMDGLQATRVIRSGSSHAALPIVAMTANAMTADRDACLAAGMNDHIGKPLELDNLVSTILRHTRGADVRGSGVSSAPLKDPATESLTLDTGNAIARLGGDQAFYAKLLDSFAAKALPAAQELVDHAQLGHRAQAAELAHRLKGTALAVGAERLGATCAQLEHLLRSGELASPEESDLVASLQPAVSATLAAQATWRQQTPRPTQSAPADQEGLLDAMRSLQEALSKADMRIFDLHEQLQRKRGNTPSPHWLALDQAIEAFDTETASAALAALITETAPDSERKSTPDSSCREGTIGANP